MAEFGLFQSIIEGDQAEAYKKKKAAEKKAREDEQSKHDFNRNAGRTGRQGYSLANPHYDDSIGDRQREKDDKRKKKAQNMVRKAGGGTEDTHGKDERRMYDAANRHLRRHGESAAYGIFGHLVESFDDEPEDEDPIDESANLGIFGRLNESDGGEEGDEDDDLDFDDDDF